MSLVRVQALVMFITLLLTGCLALASVEEWINEDESFLYEHDTLFHIGRDRQMRLLDSIQGYLFDNSTNVIFYKRNGTVYSSFDDLPITFYSKQPCGLLNIVTFVSFAFNFVIVSCFVVKDRRHLSVVPVRTAHQLNDM